MSPDVSERAFEDAIECGLLQHGPDLPAEASVKAGACAGDATAVRETPPPYGETPPGGYRHRRPRTTTARCAYSRATSWTSSSPPSPRNGNGSPSTTARRSKSSS